MGHQTCIENPITLKKAVKKFVQTTHECTRWVWRW